MIRAPGARRQRLDLRTRWLGRIGDAAVYYARHAALSRSTWSVWGHA